MLLFSISTSACGSVERRFFPFRRRGRRFLEDALVVVVHRHGQRLLGVFLADAGQVKLALDLGRLGDVDARLLLLGLRGEFLVEDLLAENDAVVADVNARPGNELLDFGVGLAAETAEREVGRAGHGGYSFLSARLVACSARPGISLRDCTTSSTRP